MLHPRPRRRLALFALALMLLAALPCSVAAAEDSCCAAVAACDEAGATRCAQLAVTRCCESGGVPIPPSQLASATVHFDAPLALLPSEPPALAPRLRLPRGAAPLPRTALLLRAAVLRL